MNKILSLTMIGLATAGLTLATPTSSQAQVPVGVGVNVGPVGVRVGGYVPGYPVALPPVYVAPAPVVYAPPVYPAYAVAPNVVVRAGFPVWGHYGHYHWHGRRH